MSLKIGNQNNISTSVSLAIFLAKLFYNKSLYERRVPKRLTVLPAKSKSTIELLSASNIRATQQSCIIWYSCKYHSIALSGTKYPRMDQVKFVEDSL